MRYNYPIVFKFDGGSVLKVKVFDPTTLMARALGGSLFEL